MPRDEYDDDEYDRPRRRRRDPDDRDYDRPPAKSNTGLILLIVGLVVGLPILACTGVGIWGYFQAKKGFDQLQTWVGGEMAAQSFLNTLEGGNVRAAYDMTSADFKASKSWEQFEQLVKANPVLTSAHSLNQTGFPSPTGTEPNRTMVLTFVVSPGDQPDDWEIDDNDPDFQPKPPRPKTTKVDPNAKTVTCTITLAEQAGGQWKVDGFTVP